MWTKETTALGGELQSSSEVDFYIDHVSDSYLSCTVVVTLTVTVTAWEAVWLIGQGVRFKCG